MYKYEGILSLAILVLMGHRLERLCFPHTGKTQEKMCPLGRKEGLGKPQATAPPMHKLRRMSHNCPLHPPRLLPDVTAPTGVTRGWGHRAAQRNSGQGPYHAKPQCELEGTEVPAVQTLEVTAGRPDPHIRPSALPGTPSYTLSLFLESPSVIPVASLGGTSHTRIDL